MTFVKKYASLFLKFGLVGALGTVINLAVFWLLVELLRIEPNIGSVAAFVTALTANYFLNQNWTFREEARGELFSAGSYARYAGVNLVGLGVNLIVLNAAIWLFHPQGLMLVQAAGIAAGTIFNFVLSKLFVFKAEQD